MLSVKLFNYFSIALVATIEWAHSQGLFEDVKETSSMAIQAKSNDQIYFIPKFTTFTASNSYFVGAKEPTDKNHLVRAVLESIVYSVAEVFLLSKKDCKSSIVR